MESLEFPIILGGAQDLQDDELAAASSPTLGKHYSTYLADLSCEGAPGVLAFREAIEPLISGLDELGKWRVAPGQLPFGRFGIWHRDAAPYLDELLNLRIFVSFRGAGTEFATRFLSEPLVLDGRLENPEFIAATKVVQPTEVALWDKSILHRQLPHHSLFRPSVQADLKVPVTREQLRRFLSGCGLMSEDPT